jgi:hypothetical protein
MPKAIGPAIAGQRKRKVVAARELKRSNFTVKRTRVSVGLVPALLDSVDGWRAQQEDKPSRSEAIAQLVAKALTTEGAH